MGLFLKLLGLTKYRLNPARIAKSILPWSGILGFAVAGMSIGFTWSFSAASKSNLALTNAIIMTVIWVISGLAIAFGIPFVAWIFAHRINDALGLAEGVKRVESKQAASKPADPQRKSAGPKKE